MVEGKRHPIQVVVRRTGLTADVLRAWERRYRAVEPKRSASGRRLYSDDDIERLRLLKRATGAGRSIGQVATLPTDELARIVRDDEVQEAEAPRPKPVGQEQSAAARHVEAAMDAVVDLDAHGLTAVLERAAVDMSVVEFLEDVVGPVLQLIGDGWHAGDLTIAHEHAASAVLRRVVGAKLFFSDGPEGAPAIVVATPSGEQHEFGAMMVAVLAATAGWRVVYLGPDCPADSIAAAAERHAPRLVALSVVSASNVEAEIATLRSLLPKDVTLVLGGSAFTEEMDIDGVVRLANLGALRTFLQITTAGKSG